MTIFSTDIVGKQSIWVPAKDIRPTVTAGCAALADVETTAGRPDMATLQFDGGTDENAQFALAMPSKWDEGTITFQPYWTATGANTGAGTVIWSLQAVAASDDDTLDVVYGTAQTSTDTYIALEDLHIGPESSAITVAGTPTAGDLVYFRITRDADTDTKTDDAALLGIKLFYTTDALVD